MAIAFTEQECNEIRNVLRETARECARTVGMKNVTVEQLVRAAGISKGAFYKFYESKEMLFLEILEELHAEVYGKAAELMEHNAHLPPNERAAQVILDVCRLLEDSGMMSFWENDLPVLLSRLSEEVLHEHYHDDREHILELLRRISPDTILSSQLSASIVRALMLTISHRRQIGECYPQALEILVRGACDRLFSMIE